MSKGFAARSRQILLASFVLASFAALGARLVHLHVLDREELLGFVSRARSRTDEIPARRGDIRDARDNLLATSRSLLIVGVDPKETREEDRKKWPQLAELLGIPLSELTKSFTTKFRSIAPASVAATTATTAKEWTFKLPEISATAAAPAVATAIDTEAEDTVRDEATDRSGLRAIRYVKLSDNVTEAAYDQIRALDIKGIVGSRAYRRTYPQGPLAAHIIGYVDRQQKPVTGLERHLDFFLHGRNGWVESEKDGKRQELAQFRTREVAAADGYSAQLSLDATVQHLIEDELSAVVAKYQPMKATIIVSDPRTGFILGLGNYPNFDPNKYNQLSKDEQASMKNIAATDQFDPGSVFKIVAAAGALNEGLVKPDSRFDCSITSIEYQGAPNNRLLTRKLPDEDHHFEQLSVSEIIAHSSNRGAAQLAMKLGDDRFYRYVQAFGFGLKTGFPGGPESSGDLKAPEQWDSLTITRMPMGHSIAATPLQMHQAMSVIASGGVLWKPKILRQIRDANGEGVYRFAGKEGTRVISEKTASTVAYMLMGVASKDGTAPEAAIPNYQVAGKTGTAQKLLPVTNARGVTRQEYSKKNHVVSFVGFLPASNPQLAISVFIDDADARCPGGVAYGSKVAAPVFKHLAEQLIQYLDIKPVSESASATVASRPKLALQGSRP